MNSALYECVVYHERFTPRTHRFTYRTFSFALDVDEIDSLCARIPWLSHNRFNLFSFYDADHVQFGHATVRANVVALLRESGVDTEAGRITLVTNLRILGYVFNPVSFYFVDDVTGSPLACVAEVNNTFGERKLYVISRDGLRDGRFTATRTKYFYISPFVPLDADLHLDLAVPGERLRIAIDDFTAGARALTATMNGVRRELTAARLLWFAFKYPLLTVKIILAIHWQALRLWAGGVPLLRKNANLDLQRDLHHPRPVATHSAEGDALA